MTTRDDGSIMIIALWTVAILSLLAIGGGYSAWTETRLSAYQIDRLRDARLLQAGVELARQQLPNGGSPVMSLKDSWASQPSLFKEVNLPEGTFSLTRPSVDGADHYGLDDEQGRLNINTAPLWALQNLLGEAHSDVAQAITEWRGDGGGSGTASRDEFYGGLKNAYATKQAPFESVEELLLVQGMTPELYEKIRPWVTVYTDGLVNINTAPRPVLAALGWNDELINLLFQFRLGPDGQEGTDDDGVFPAVAAISPALSQINSLDGDEQVELSAAVPLLTTRSGCFRVHFALNAPHAAPLDGERADFILAASGLQGQWIIKHFSGLY